jgi:hypothetical protein
MSSFQTSRASEPQSLACPRRWVGQRGLVLVWSSGSGGLGRLGSPHSRSVDGLRELWPDDLEPEPLRERCGRLAVVPCAGGSAELPAGTPPSSNIRSKPTGVTMTSALGLHFERVWHVLP